MPSTPSVIIQAPADGAIVAPTARAVVVDIFQPGTDSAREFHITVNAVNVLTVIAGVATFVAGGYGCVVSTPITSVERVVLTRTSDWPNPSDLNITAAYRAEPAGLIYAANSLGIAASYTFQAGSPYPGQPDVAPGSDVALSITTTATVLSAQLFVDNVLAVAVVPPDPAAWNMPDFQGRLIYAGGSLSISMNARRLFDPEQVVGVGLDVQLNAGGLVSINNNFFYQFHVRPSTTELLNPLLRFTRLDRVFENAAASETLRYMLRGALLTRPLAPSFEVALYFQILLSSLGSVASQFQRPDLDAELPRLVAEDIPDVAVVDAAISEVNLLWESVLMEAAELGLSRELLQLIAKTYEAPYPQERVGAACALILVQAAMRS